MFEIHPSDREGRKRRELNVFVGVDYEVIENEY